VDAAEYNRRSAQVICYVVGGVILLVIAAMIIIPAWFSSIGGAL